MTTSQNKVFDYLFMSPVITYMSQENIIVVAEGKDTNPMAILVHLYQWSAPPLSAQDTTTPVYGCRLSDIF